MAERANSSRASRPRGSLLPPSLQIMREEEEQETQMETDANVQDSSEGSKPLFPVSSASLFPLASSVNSSSGPEQTSMPSFSSFSFKKKQPEAPKPAAPVVPQAGRRPRALDFFDDDNKQRLEVSETTEEPVKLVPVAPSQSTNLGIVTRRTITEYIEDSDSDSSSDDSSTSSARRKHKRREKHKKSKREKKRKKKDKKPSKDKNEKKQKHHEDSSDWALEPGSKRRKISDSDSGAASSSVRDKLKMLELNLKNIKDDPRSRPSMDSADNWAVVGSNPGGVVTQSSAATNGWFEDTIGDQNNLQFGLYKGDVPSFYRCRSVLGMPDYKVVKWGKDSSNFKIFDLRYESIANRNGSGSAGVEASHIDRYYFLGSARDIQQRERAAAKQKVQNQAQAASKAQTKTKTEFDEVRDVVSLEDTAETDSAQRDEEETFEEFLSRRTKHFNERTRFDRSNIKNWQDFVALQDEFAHVGSTRAMILEQKIEIYKVAIEANPHSDELVLGMIQTCSQLYSTERTQRIWQETIARNPDSALLWRNYLAFVQSNFSSFTISSLRNVYNAALKALNRQKRMYNVGIPKNRGLEEKALALSIKAIHLEKQSGYHERATSMFQALIEYNLFVPEEIKSAPREKLISFFQAFWNSEIPRFAEDAARGWMSWFDDAQKKSKSKDPMAIIQDYDPSTGTADEDLDKMRELLEMEKLLTEKRAAAAEASTPSIPTVPGRNVPPPKLDPVKNAEFLSWLENEDALDSTKWLSQRTVSAGVTDEDMAEVDEDPDRVVLFEDIKDFLFQVSYEDLKFDLVREFVQFLGLRWPISHHTSESQESSENLIDDFAQVFTVLDKLHFPPVCSRLEDDTEAPAIQKKYTEIIDCVRFYLEDDVLHPSAKLPTRRQLLRNCLSQSIERFSLAFKNEINLERLIFEGHVSSTSQEVAAARSLAKTLLKQDSSNLTLWAAYAKMERLQNNIKEATKVYQVALSNLPKLPESAQASAPTLIRQYAEMLLFSHNQATFGDLANTLLGLFLSDFATDSSSATRLMRARKSYESFIESTKTSFFNKANQKLSLEATQDKIICFAILEYVFAVSQLEGKQDFVQGQQVLDRSMDVLEQGIKIFFVRSAHENLVCFRVLLALLETLRPSSTVKPTHLRHCLESGLRQLPGNSFLLSALLVAESRNQLLGRMRLLFDELLSAKSAGSLTWLFAVRSETKRGAGNRIRALFERALTQPQSLSSPALLWKYYIDFELGQSRVPAAKGIFFRAIRYVPWSKSMWLYCLRQLSQYMTLSELSDVFSLMTDKEIRLRSTPPL